MKTTFKLGMLFLAVAFVACRKDTPEEETKIPEKETGTIKNPETFDFKIVDGMIQSPKWLVDKVEEVADRYDPTPSGEKLYPWVYLFEYNGQDYVHILDGFITTAYERELFFNLYGNPAIWTGSWIELVNMQEDDENLLWRKDIPEDKTGTFDFKIVDGMIQSPKWLANKVEEVADRYGRTTLGENFTPGYTFSNTMDGITFGLWTA